jgi:hypothetical protein
MRTLSQKEKQGHTTIEFHTDFQCIFTSIDVPCEFCQGRGIGSSCIKKWGQKKEESMAISKEAAAAKKEKCTTVSRQIPTAIDETIRHEDVLLLQFAYSDSFVFSGGGIIGHLLRRMAVSYSPSINSQPLRHAVLAFSAAFLPRSNISYFDRLEYHKTAACTSLRKKLSSTVDESDLFAVCLLAVLSGLYLDRTEFAIHRSGFVSIMKELCRKIRLQGGLSPLSLYWPLARDMILRDCRSIDCNENALSFCYFSQKLMGPQNFAARGRYFSELYGISSERLRLHTYYESILMYSLLLRRCFRHTVYMQLHGQLKCSFIVTSIVSEVDNDLRSPEVTRIRQEIFPGASVEGAAIELDPAWGNSFIYTILLHHFCELLIAYLNADSILQSASSLEATRAASSLVRFLNTEWLVLNQVQQFSADPQLSMRTQATRLKIPRMLWLAGITFTKNRDPLGMFSRQNVFIR